MVDPVLHPIRHESSQLYRRSILEGLACRRRGMTHLRKHKRRTSRRSRTRRSSTSPQHKPTRFPKAQYHTPTSRLDWRMSDVAWWIFKCKTRRQRKITIYTPVEFQMRVNINKQAYAKIKDMTKDSRGRLICLICFHELKSPDFNRMVSTTAKKHAPKLPVNTRSTREILDTHLKSAKDTTELSEGCQSTVHRRCPSPSGPPRAT